MRRLLALFIGRDESPARRRLSGDRGAVIAEAALFGPFLVLLALGIFEFGMGWRESMNLGAALRGSARQATNLGDARSADYYALQSFFTTMTKAKGVTINRLVVYRATGANGQPVNPNCLTIVPTGPGQGISGACNIYTASQINNLPANYLTNFGPDGSCATNAWDVRWCPVNRNADQGDPPDYVGVYASITYKSYTKLLPTTITMTDRAVMRIEPSLD